jgi:hypothetical protein
MVIQCEECEMWRVIYSRKKLDPQNLCLLEKILEDVVYTYGTTFDELDLPPSLSTVCIRRFIIVMIQWRNSIIPHAAQHLHQFVIIG